MTQAARKQDPRIICRVAEAFDMVFAELVLQQAELLATNG